MTINQAVIHALHDNILVPTVSCPPTPNTNININILDKINPMATSIQGYGSRMSNDRSVDVRMREHFPAVVSVMNKNIAFGQCFMMFMHYY